MKPLRDLPHASPPGPYSASPHQCVHVEEQLDRVLVDPLGVVLPVVFFDPRQIVEKTTNLSFSSSHSRYRIYPSTGI